MQKTTSNAVTLPPGVPPRLDRRAAAKLLTDYYFPTSVRTMPELPLPWRIVNRKALVETKDLVAWAQAKLDQAPMIRGGRRARAEQVAA